MAETVISLRALFDLTDGLAPFVDTADRFGAQHAVLRWAEAQGVRLDQLAADMRISATDLKNRWRALLSCVGTPEGAPPKLADQDRLLHVLRHRAGAVPSAEAAE